MRVLSVIAVVAFSTLSAQAALTFSGNACSDNGDGSGAFTSCEDFDFINQSYGDTAEVDITYRDVSFPGFSLSYWSTTYSDLTGVAWAGDSSTNSSGEIVLMPLGGRQISLLSFQAGAYENTSRNTNIQIRNAVTNAILIDYGLQVISGDTASTFLPALTNTDGFIIAWQNDAFSVGLDNIDFAVSEIPEPSAFALAGFGLLAAGLFRHSRCGRRF